MTANIYILHYKLDGVVNEYAKMANIPTRKAFDVFYRSLLYTEVHDGISDMHCRSDGYLAEELMLEQKRNSEGKNLT
jgi:hypothetical protein